MNDLLIMLVSQNTYQKQFKEKRKASLDSWFKKPQENKSNKKKYLRLVNQKMWRNSKTTK